ncbi:MAG: cytochrome C biogenesis protein [Bacteroidetes bacterium]|nr:MAG: cytochrome C biogenesis protein [Bacteroidota bacterium]
MKYFFLPLIMVLFNSSILFSQKEVKIEGVVSNNTKFEEVFVEDIIQQTVLASSRIDSNGKFSISAKLDKTNFYKLKFNDEHYLILILNPGDKIDINADINNLYTPEIKGSENSALIYSTFDAMQAYDKKIEELTQKIEVEKKEYIRNLILDNLNSLSSLFFIDNLSIDEDIEIFKKLDASLSKKYPDNFLVMELHNKLAGSNNLAIGSQAPEIDLPNPEGKNIKLSSLKGKYVLIDFWAAWCGPCRRESPNMVSLYENFYPKGFDIYSVSLDQTKEAWEKAIRKDGLGKWTHVSDLKYWNSAAGKAYGVESIPFTVLIDPEGKIIAKGLRGDDLRTKLEKIFN